MKITAISDTHMNEPILPGGDLLIHAGDLSIHGFRVEMFRQLNYLHEQLDKYTNVILTVGNHDLYAERHLDAFKEACFQAGVIFLLNEPFDLDGLKLWASPVVPRYNDWAFNLNQSDRYDMWEKIPRNTDILITHTPPKGILDLNARGDRIGCIELTNKVNEIKPRIHVFGHCHESKGFLETKDTIFLNAATTMINLDFNLDTKKTKII